MTTGNEETSLGVGRPRPSGLKAKLADILTLTRVVLGVVILSLSLVGRDAYIAVVILVIIGGITDIFDGRIARRYLGGGQEGILGKHDLEIDTFFVLCALGYFSFSGIVIPMAVGLSWIGLAVIVIAVYRAKPKILLIFEVPTILTLIVISGFARYKAMAPKRRPSSHRPEDCAALTCRKAYQVGSKGRQ